MLLICLLPLRFFFNVARNFCLFIKRAALFVQTLNRRRELRHSLRYHRFMKMIERKEHPDCSFRAHNRKCMTNLRSYDECAFQFAQSALARRSTSSSHFPRAHVLEHKAISNLSS